MCTVSFLPKAQGFYLAMNRDEKLERSTALPPKIVDLASRRVILPREPTGGTWISANDAGVCLALINWHRVAREPKHDVISRGEVVRELAGKSSADEIAYAAKEAATAQTVSLSVDWNCAIGENCHRMALEFRMVDHA